jgi:hypothetical protein
MRVAALPLGKPLVHPAVDLLLIGGGLSFVVFALVGAGMLPKTPGGAAWVLVVFGANLAHFAASTVRLYTKRGASRELPFATFALPLVTLAVLVLSLAFAQYVGWHLVNLYLTWSAYHYAAQTYGIAMIYWYRSGAAPEEGERRLLRAACLAPFLYLFIKGPEAGLEWLVPMSVLDTPLLAPARSALVQCLAVATVVMPLLVYARSLWRGRAFPLISVIAMLANASWWMNRDVVVSFAWVALFHGLQYLPIVTAFHVRERLKEPGNTRGWLYHAAWFYACCLAVAYFLFATWPYAFLAVGFGGAESALLVLATINIHHFIVDRYIWRLRKDPNYRVVTDEPLATSPVPVVA